MCLLYRKLTARCAHYETLKIFGSPMASSPEISEILNELFFRKVNVKSKSVLCKIVYNIGLACILYVPKMNMRTKLEVRSFTHS